MVGGDPCLIPLRETELAAERVDRIETAKVRTKLKAAVAAAPPCMTYYYVKPFRSG